MNISLTPELDKYVQQKVETGLYHSASEVIRAGLRLLKDQDSEREAKLTALRADIDIGVKQIEEGKYTEYTVDNLDLFEDEMMKRIREAHARRNGQ